MHNKIQVVIIDDHVIFRNGVVSILQTEPDIDVVGQGVSATEAIQLAHDLLPDVILLDISIPGNGLAAAREIARTCPVVKIVMLTASTEEENILEAFKAGAQAYLFKGVVTSELVSILKEVNLGMRFLPAALAELLTDRRAASDVPPHTKRIVQEKLTERERAILTMIAENKSLGEIGRQVGLNIRTVQKLATNIVEKLNLHVIK